MPRMWFRVRLNCEPSLRDCCQVKIGARQRLFTPRSAKQITDLPDFFLRKPISPQR